MITKLYGGTKEEMQRLLDDAEKISGIKYDISSFADVTQAIHVIQTELGITGTTALEASSTIQGSASAMKASWQNLLTGMADPTQNFDALLQNFISSLGTYIGNLLPVLTTAAEGVLQMVEGLLPQIPSLLSKMLPVAVSGISKIISGIIKVLPQVVQTVVDIIPQISTELLNMLPQLIEAGMQILLSLIEGLTEALPQLIAMLPEIINTIITVLIENLPLIIEAGIQLLIAIVTGLSEAIPQLTDYMPTIIDTMITTLLSNLSLLIDCAIQLLVAIITGLIQALPQLAAMTPQIIITIVTTLKANLPKLLEAGKTLLTSVIDGIKSILSKINEVGKNIVDGLWEGIQNSKTWLLGKIKEWCGSVLNGIKAFFGIHSPSTVMRDEVGKMIPRGMAVGIDKAKNYVTKSIKGLVTDTRSEVQKVLDEMNEEMLESEKLYAEESIRLKKSTSEADKEYLENLKETAEKERKIFDARKKDVENLQNDIVDAYDEMSNQILDDIQKLQDAQDDLGEKLANYGEYMQDEVVEAAKEVRNNFKFSEYMDENEMLLNPKFNTKELQRYGEMMLQLRDRAGMSPELFKEIANMSFEDSYAMAKKLTSLSNKRFEDYVTNWAENQRVAQELTEALFPEEQEVEAERILTDLSAQNEELREFAHTMELIKDRGIPDELFKELRDMPMDEGMEFANALLDLSDEDFAQYLADWQEKQRLSKEISKQLYKDEAEELAKEIDTKFQEVEQSFFGVGENSANEFEEGFLNQLGTVVANIKGAIRGAFNNVNFGVTPIGSAVGIPVPAMATGGIVPHRTFAMIGEAGAEAVLPLENNTGWMDMLADRLVSRIGGGSSTVVLEVDGREFGRAVVEQGNRENRRIGTRLVNR